MVVDELDEEDKDKITIMANGVMTVAREGRCHQHSIIVMIALTVTAVGIIVRIVISIPC